MTIKAMRRDHMMGSQVKFNSAIFVLVVILLSIWLTPAPGHSQSLPTDVYGKVYYDGSPIDGASVTWSGTIGGSQTTSGGGKYHISASGAITISVSASYGGHSASTGSFTVGNGGSVQKDISISSGGGSGGSPGGGSGGGSGQAARSTDTPSTTQVFPIYSTKGQLIGNFTLEGYTTTTMKAEKDGIANGNNVSVALECMLGRIPSGAKLDVTFYPVNDARLPAGFKGIDVLASANVTRYSDSGWDIKPRSWAMSFSLPSSVAIDDDAGNYIVVRYEGLTYQVLGVDMAVNNSTGVSSFKCVSPYDGLFSLDSSDYALVHVNAMPGSGSPTPLPIITSLSPTPVPQADTGYSWTQLATLLVIIVVIVLLIALVAYMAIIRK